MKEPITSRSHDLTGENSELHLTNEQAEVRRRLSEVCPKMLTLAEFNERLHRRYDV